MASSGPMIASTVWKNFLGTIGARSRTESSDSSRPVGAASPPRSKYERMSGQSSSTTVPPSSRPTRPSSNVTSFMASSLVGGVGGVQLLLLQRHDGRLEGGAEVRPEQPLGVVGVAGGACLDDAPVLVDLLLGRAAPGQR